MECKKCGAALEDGWAYCPVCGKARERKVTHKKRGNGQGSVYKRGNTYTAAKVYGYKDGRPVRETKAGFLAKQDALMWLAEHNRPKSRATLRQVWEEASRAREWTPENASSMARAFGAFREVENWALARITIDDLQEIFDGLTYSKSYQAKARCALSITYDYAIPRGIVTTNLAHYIRIGGDEGRRDAFTREELDKIRDAVGKVKNADIIYINCYTGYRPSELFSRRIEDFVPDEMAILGGAKTDKGKSRAVTLSPKIQQLVLDRIGGRTAGYIIENMDARKWAKMFGRILREIGIDRGNLTPYSCRHTFASLMDRAIGGDKAKMDLMGHTTVAMTRHYQHTDYEDLRKITDNL